MIGYNAVRVAVDPAAVARNFVRLRSHGCDLVAVVKADAYGHGLVPVAKAIAQAGGRRFAVGTVAEGVSLRQALPTAQIIALLGAMDMDDARACQRWGIVPVATHWEHWTLMEAAAEEGNGPCAAIILKFDTGMGRLGFAPHEAAALGRRLRETPSLRAVAVFSHLATADVPDDADFVAEQVGCLRAILADLAAAGLSLPASLANSAGLLAHPSTHFDLQRPGIALYGANPLASTAWEDRCPPLEAAMQVDAPILQVHEVPAGASVSYGRTFRAPRPMRLAVVAVGYADAYSRGLSNRAAMVVGGRRAPVVGRVCMQMTVVDVTDIPGVRPGDRAYLLGGPGAAAITATELAAWWGTIPYEVFCLLGLNPRVLV